MTLPEVLTTYMTKGMLKSPTLLENQEANQSCADPSDPLSVEAEHTCGVLSIPGVGRERQKCPRHSLVFKKHVVPKAPGDPSKGTMIWATLLNQWTAQVTPDETKKKILGRTSGFGTKGHQELSWPDSVEL